MVEAALDLIELARSVADYGSFAFISGDSYPAVSDVSLMDFMRSEYSWIDINETSRTSEKFARIRNVYLPDTAIGALAPYHWAIKRCFDDDVPPLEDLYAARDLKKSDFPWRYAAGSCWWKLNSDTIQTIADVARDRSEFLSWFRYSASPDESFFNSALLNFHPDMNLFRDAPMCDLWEGGSHHPKNLWSEKDFKAITGSGKPFARKFAGAYHEILSKMDRL